ncbi:MAG: exonuclease domain-containing protein, partial [Parcubacteria group bacterium]
MKPTFPKTCVALDLETTDLTPNRGDIIEVAAAKFKGDKVIAEFQFLTKPSGKIPTIVTAITNITDEQVAKAPPFADVKDDLIKFVGKHPIVGHNINFDLNFLAGKGVKLANPRYDTWKLATLLAPELSSHSLEVLTNYLKIKHVESHRALDDVLASKDLFLQLVERIYEVDYGVLQEINRFAAKHDWGLAAVFKQVLTARRSEKGKRQGLENRPAAKPKTTGKRQTVGKAAQRKVSLVEIEALFKKKEQLGRVITNYKFRPGQVALMKQLVQDFTNGKRSIINAGPGVGRYLAYLVAAAYQAQAQQTSQPVAISVGSFPLQKQLFTEEVQVAQKITPFNFTPALLEDRRKYLCRRRFEQFKNKPKLSATQMEALAKLLLWLDIAQFGLFTEMAWGYEDYRVEEQINCAAKYCLEKDCPYHQDCFYYNALEQAQKSDVVIFNHAALAAEGRSLGVKNIILDEAQELEKQLTDYLSFQLSENNITRKLSWLDHDSGFLRLIPKKALLKKTTKSKVAALIKQTTKIKDKTTLFFGVLGIFTSQQQQDLGTHGDYFDLPLDRDVRQYPEWDRVKQA